MKTTRVGTVVLPMAGNGSRMRPATNAVPKELLPVYDTPLLKFALEEAAASEVQRIVLVIRSTKPGLKAYVDSLLSQPESFLGDTEIVFAEQDEPLGLGHAVLCARGQATAGLVGVIPPDDLILGAPALAEMCAAFDPDRMRCLIAAEAVDAASVSNYGVFDLEAGATDSRAMPARGLVEKPAPQDAPSNYAAVGRYILSEDIWDILETTEPGAGDEIQLTDAITSLGGLHAFRFSGRRYDCGSKEGLWAASEAFRAARLAAENAATHSARAVATAAE